MALRCRDKFLMPARFRHVMKHPGRNVVTVPQLTYACPQTVPPSSNHSSARTMPMDGSCLFSEDEDAENATAYTTGRYNLCKAKQEGF